jgi:hypothetical protein
MCWLQDAAPDSVHRALTSPTTGNDPLESGTPTSNRFTHGALSTARISSAPENKGRMNSPIPPSTDHESQEVPGCQGVVVFVQ